MAEGNGHEPLSKTAIRQSLQNLVGGQAPGLTQVPLFTEQDWQWATVAARVVSKPGGQDAGPGRQPASGVLKNHGIVSGDLELDFFEAEIHILTVEESLNLVYPRNKRTGHIYSILFHMQGGSVSATASWRIPESGLEMSDVGENESALWTVQPMQGQLWITEALRFTGTGSLASTQTKEEADEEGTTGGTGGSGGGSDPSDPSDPGGSTGGSGGGEEEGGGGTEEEFEPSGFDKDGLGWGFDYSMDGSRLDRMTWLPEASNQERALSWVTLTDELHDQMQEAHDNGLEVGHYVFRRDPGETEWNQIRKRKFSTFPLQRNDDGEYQAGWIETESGKEDQDREYTHEPFIGSERGDKNGTGTVYLGPPPPTGGSVSAGGSSGEVDVSWTNGFKSGLHESIEEDEDWATIVEYRNVTQDGNWTQDAKVDWSHPTDPPNDEHTIEGRNSGDEVEVRVRHYSRYINNDDLSKWTNLGSVTVP